MTKGRNKHQNLRALPQKVLMHPHQALIEDQLRALGLAFNITTRGEPPVGITYSLYFDSGIAAFLSLYKDVQGVCFLFFEVILGMVPQEDQAALILEMMKENYEAYHSLWLGLSVRDMGAFASLVFRTEADSVAAESVAPRVKTIIELGIRLQEKYVNEFGLEVRTEFTKTERKLAS